MVAGRGRLAAVPDGPIPAIASIRVSKAREEMISPDIQRTAITRWADANNRRIVDWLEDLDRTGRHFGKRKVLEGIERISAGEASEILVYRYDRWGRNAAESLTNIARVEQAGGQVVSVSEPFDAETAIGKYTRTNALALAEMQSDIISENWKAAHANRRERGLTHSGNARFGYNYTRKADGGDGLYHLNENTAPLLARMYERAPAGTSFSALATELNAAGYRTDARKSAKTNLWTAGTVRNMLDSGFGAGLIRTGRGSGALYLPGAHDPVVSGETWERYRIWRLEKGGESPARRKAATYRLSGLLLCGYCGWTCGHTSSHADQAGKSIVCTLYKKHKKCVPMWLPRHRVEAAVRSEIEAILRQWEDETIAAVREENRKARAQVDETLLKRDLAETERLLLKAFDLLNRELVDEDTYKAQRLTLEARRDEIEAALTAKPAEPSTDALRGVLDIWDVSRPAALNSALRWVVSAVVVTKGRVLVVPKWDPPW